MQFIIIKTIAQSITIFVSHLYFFLWTDSMKTVTAAIILKSIMARIVRELVEKTIIMYPVAINYISVEF